jgi:hypothetical protein
VIEADITPHRLGQWFLCDDEDCTQIKPMTNALSQTDEAADPDVIMVDSASELESEAIDVDTQPRER